MVLWERRLHLLCLAVHKLKLLTMEEDLMATHFPPGLYAVVYIASSSFILGSSALSC